MLIVYWVPATVRQDSPCTESAYSVISNMSESLKFVSICSKDSFPATAVSLKQKGAEQ